MRVVIGQIVMGLVGGAVSTAAVVMAALAGGVLDFATRDIDPGDEFGYIEVAE